ncbi:MAG TPA: methyltransferase domain-containing protein [Terriglobales bacterium]|nr:methyltransferase domain-containing protein [Terriglobales bacterium]
MLRAGFPYAQVEMPDDQDYVLGAHDQEIERLGVQHRAWKQRALAVWQSAGIGPGQTILDVGCGPGYASLDLAELVGPSGGVVAIDRCERFLRVLDATCRERSVDNITAHLNDLDSDAFPDVVADCAWCRWVLAFVRNPQAILARMAAALTSDGVVVLHEYFDYSTWRAAPRCSELEEFVSAVMASWRDNGGEPDIGLRLPRWLEELGFELRSARPIIEVVQPDHLSWIWLATFVDVGRGRLVDLGYLSASRAESIWQAFTTLQATPGARMITPGVLEIVAVRRRRSP